MFYRTHKVKVKVKVKTERNTVFHRTHKVKVRIEKSGRKGRKKNFSIGQEICACSASEEVVLHETSHAEISANKKASRKQERGEGKDDGYNIKTINSLNSKKSIKNTSDYDISKIGGSVNIKGTKTCPSCGGTDHQRSSSKLCMAKKKTSPPPKEKFHSRRRREGQDPKKEGAEKILVMESAGHITSMWVGLMRYSIQWLMCLILPLFQGQLNLS